MNIRRLAASFAAAVAIGGIFGTAGASAEPITYPSPSNPCHGMANGHVVFPQNPCPKHHNNRTGNHNPGHHRHHKHHH